MISLHPKLPRSGRHCQEPHLTHAICPRLKEKGGNTGGGWSSDVAGERGKGRVSGLFNGLSATS